MFLLELSAWIASSVSCSLALMKNPSVLRFIGCLAFPTPAFSATPFPVGCAWLGAVEGGRLSLSPGSAQT